RSSDLDVFALNFIFVMQRRTSNSASTHQYWLQHCHWRENSGAPDLDRDVLPPRLPPFGLVFVGDGPPRRFRRETEMLALCKRVHFYHRAVGLISKLMADAVQFVNCIQNFFD